MAGQASRTGLWVVCALLITGGFFTSNGLVTSAAFLVLPIVGFFLWRQGEPPVLLFGCTFQWLQATAAIFYTNHFGVTLDEAFGSHVLTEATWLSIVAVLVLALGIKLALFGAGPSRQADLEADGSRLDINKILLLYGVAFVMSGAFNAVAWRFASITQPLLALAALKWAVVFLLSYAVMQQRQGYGALAAVVALEFGMGLFGVFANFKSVFFVLVVAALSSPMALRGRRLVASLSCFVILGVLGIVWSAVKMDYRQFLADVATGEEETIPIEQRVGELGDLVASITWDNFVDGLDALILRVSYVNYFALTIENVPLRVPFEDGELWKGAIVHVLTPRLLFPDKATLDDSERTRLYTGLEVSGMESGTSIGIGYIGESYVDFGPTGMFAPIFLLGLLYGLVYRFFVMKTRYALLGSSLAVSTLVFNAYEIEVSNVKLVGGLIASAIASVLVYKIFGASIMASLQKPSPRRLQSVPRSNSPQAAGTIK